MSTRDDKLDKMLHIHVDHIFKRETAEPLTNVTTAAVYHTMYQNT